VVHLPIQGEGPATGLPRLGTEGQAGVVHHVGGQQGASVAGQVIRAGHTQAAVVGQAHADQAGIGQITHADGAIEAFVDQIHQVVGQIERQRHLRVLAHKLRHQGRHVPATEAGRCGDAQVPAGLDAAGADAGLGIGQVGQHALSIFQEGAALVRQADAPGGAHQQLDAQALFQPVNAAPDHGRGHPLGRRRRGQTALEGNSHERFDLLESVHACALPLVRPAPNRDVAQARAKKQSGAGPPPPPRFLQKSHESIAIHGLNA